MPDHDHQKSADDVTEEVVTEHIFYSSKPRIIHMAINIAFAPALLYLLGLWSWPPLLAHYIAFALTFLIALNYSRRRWSAPRLVLNDAGLTCGKFYADEYIFQAKPSLRSVTLTVLSDAKIKDKVISLGWASREDCHAIQQLLANHFRRTIPKIP